jgi:hypothetical protein
MTLGRTARDVPPRELLPLIVQYLKDCGFSKPIGNLPFSESEVMGFESWILNQLANLLFQLYLYPCFNVPGFGARGCNSTVECALIKKLHQYYAKKLIATGWVVKDRTGIFYLPDAVCNHFDALARSIQK